VAAWGGPQEGFEGEDVDVQEAYEADEYGGWNGHLRWWRGVVGEGNEEVGFGEKREDNASLRCWSLGWVLEWCW
jgi:hypothetical protein